MGVVVEVLGDGAVEVVLGGVHVVESTCSGRYC